MFNPLSPNLTDLSIDDLTKRMSKLHARLAEATQFGRQEVIDQVRNMLVETSEELSKRSRDLKKKPDDKDKPKSRKDPENMDPYDIGEND